MIARFRGLVTADIWLITRLFADMSPNSERECSLRDLGIDKDMVEQQPLLPPSSPSQGSLPFKGKQVDSRERKPLRSSKLKCGSQMRWRVNTSLSINTTFASTLPLVLPRQPEHPSQVLERDHCFDSHDLIRYFYGYKSFADLVILPQPPPFPIHLQTTSCVPRRLIQNTSPAFHHIAKDSLSFCFRQELCASPRLKEPADETETNGGPPL